MVFVFLKTVIEKKRNCSNSLPFPLQDYLITKQIKWWLRDKIWNCCYYAIKGDEWRETIYDKKSKHIGDIEGMKTSSVRAKDIMNGVCINLSIIINITLQMKI